MLDREFNGRRFCKSPFSADSNTCVYLPKDGVPNAVADNKSGLVLAGVDAGALVRFARATTS